RRARHQHVGARADRQRCGGRIDAAVHFEAARRPELIDHFPRTADLRQRGGKKMLVAEAGIDRHHQHLVDVLYDFFDHRGGGRRVAGLVATATPLPSGLMCCTVRERSLLPSQWTMNESTPASANSSRKMSGFEIIRCASSGSGVARRSDLTIGAPIERLGTK